MEELDYLRRMLMEVPMAMALFKREERIIRFANRLMQQAWDRDDTIIGRRFPEDIPELNAFDFPERLGDVYTSGIPYTEVEREFTFHYRGEPKTFYYNSDLTPI